MIGRALSRSVATAIVLIAALPAAGAMAGAPDGARQAALAFPASPCAHTMVFVYDPGLRDEPDHRDGEYRGGCVAAILPGLPAERDCEVKVHEAGHAAGLDHAPVGSGSVMEPSEHDWPGCSPLPTKRELRLQAKALIADEHPGWAVVCGPTHRVMSCRALHGRSTRRYRVSVDLAGGSVSVAVASSRGALVWGGSSRRARERVAASTTSRARRRYGCRALVTRSASSGERTRRCRS